MAEITNTDVIKAWTTVPQETIENFGEEGDMTRKHLLNPAIFQALGDVRGKAILVFSSASLLRRSWIGMEEKRDG